MAKKKKKQSEKQPETWQPDLLTLLKRMGLILVWPTEAFRQMKAKPEIVGPITLTAFSFFIAHYYSFIGSSVLMFIREVDDPRYLFLITILMTALPYGINLLYWLGEGYVLHWLCNKGETKAEVKSILCLTGYCRLPYLLYSLASLAIFFPHGDGFYFNGSHLGARLFFIGMEEPSLVAAILSKNLDLVNLSYYALLVVALTALFDWEKEKAIRFVVWYYLMMTAINISTILVTTPPN